MIENIDGMWFLTDIGFFLFATSLALFCLVLTFTVIDNRWLQDGELSPAIKIAITLMMSALVGAILLALERLNILVELAIVVITLIIAGSFGYYGGRILGWLLEGGKDG